MDNIIIQPTTTAGWHELVNIAQANANTFLPEELESYLVFLLMRFTDESHLAETVVGLDLLESAHQHGSARSDTLQHVADNCLIIAGLFPNRAERRRVRLTYYIEVGRTAFSQLACNDEYFNSHVDRFIDMLDVLNATRASNECTIGNQILLEKAKQHHSSVDITLTKIQH